VATRGIALVAATSLLGATLVACGGGDGGGGGKSTTLTYWASNQAPTPQLDQKALAPVLKEFKQQTGITVNLQVIGWPDLQNRINTAVSSGKGPDVVNIGNTWSSSYQATGAFLPFDGATANKIGGMSKFVPTTQKAIGAPGKAPTAVPLYGLAYGLFYNKKLFKEAKIDAPPKTWSEFVADAKKLTDPAKKVWGVGLEGGSYTEGVHHAFILGEQNGATLFNGTKPNFTSAQEVNAVKSYVDLMATDKVANPSDAQNADGTKTPANFAKGKAAMILWQGNAATNIAQAGMKPSEYGVAPYPQTAGGKSVGTFVAGINVSVFKNTKNQDGALKFVKFMTDPKTQATLNTKFGTLPVNTKAAKAPAFNTPQLQMFINQLATRAQPLPQIPEENNFETTVGDAVKKLVADAAQGKPVGDAQIRSALSAAQQKMEAGG
jgi:multiple sugar transport system substrate-binding protein